MYSGGEVDGGRPRYQWVVPRRVMCAMFWAAVILIFIGMVLLVTSHHKDKGTAFQSWGAVVVGLGLCIILSCIILCVHTYCVMSRRNRQNMDNGNSGSRSQGHLSNATVSTAMMQGYPSDVINGNHRVASPPRISRPPHYGISIVTTPPPTVRLYVSDVINRDDVVTTHLDRPEIVIVEPQSSPDYPGVTVSGGGQNHVMTGSRIVCGENESNCGETWRRRLSSTGSSTLPPPNRKSSSASVGAQTPSTLKTTCQPNAADAWLSQQQQQQQQAASRAIPLPFPPAHITFSELDIDVTTGNDATGGVVGMSSCDDSFNQSTETIIAKDEEKSSSKRLAAAAAIARRKSVYINAVEQTPLSTSGSETAIAAAVGVQRQQQPPVVMATTTLPKGRRHRDHVNFAPTSTAVAIESTSRTDNTRSLSSNVGKDRPSRAARHRGDDEVGSRLSSTGPAEQRQAAPTKTSRNESAGKCRVTRINLHSSTTTLPLPSYSEATASLATTQSPTSPTHVDFKTAASAAAGGGGGHFATSSVASPSIPTDIGGSSGVRFHAAAAAASSASSASRDRRVQSTAAPTTTRTCGTACVTVTPLGQRDLVVDVDQCPRFPASGGSRRWNDELEDQDAAMRPLDAADLLRAEYDASFGGQVNPLLLYSGALDEDVNLSKRTVYDNIQYFKV